MGTSVVRLVIVAALVLGGVGVLIRAFPEGEEDGMPPGRSPSPSPTASPTGTPKPPPSPQVEGVRIAVFNGTEQAGLAGEWQARLEEAGYEAAQPPADAPDKPLARTIVYFRASAQNRVNAEHLAEQFFPEARVKKLPEDISGVKKAVKIAVFVGEDYTLET